MAHMIKRNVTSNHVKRLGVWSSWLPAIIFPGATMFQLIPVLQGQTTGVSPISWALFGLANFGAYISSTQKHTPQVILAFLINGILDVFIVVRCLFT